MILPISDIIRKTFLIAGLIVFISSSVFSQNNNTELDSTKKNNNLRKVIIAEGALYGGSLFALNSLWYKDYPRSSFHFFNDNNEWLQMDKAGHAATGYLTGRTGYELFKWAGLNEKQSTWFGGSLGFLYLMNIEILDGFSKEWGASAGDLAANTLGSGMFISQQLCWHEQRVTMKYSFHQTNCSKYREDILGSNIWENSVKDYNGQTYWFSANIKSFCNESSNFPAWLNIAFGYGAEEMIEGTESGDYPNFKRYRQYYLAPDIDFTKIKTNSPFVKKLLFVVNIFKIPSPSLEFSKKKFRTHLLYF